MVSATEPAENNLFSPFRPGRLYLFKKQYAGAGNVYCRISADNGSDQQGESKIADDRSAENIQGQHGKKHGKRSQNGSAQSLVDRGVDDITEFLFGILFYYFPDSVQRDDSVINGKTDNENDCRENGYGEFHVHYGNSPDDDQGVMNQGENSSRGVTEFESPGHINQYCQPGKNNGNDCLPGKVGADF